MQASRPLYFPHARAIMPFLINLDVEYFTYIMNEYVKTAVFVMLILLIELSKGYSSSFGLDNPYFTGVTPIG